MFERLGFRLGLKRAPRTLLPSSYALQQRGAFGMAVSGISIRAVIRYLPHCRQSRMYGPPPCRKRKMKVDRMVCANVFGLSLEHKAPGLDGMRCALVLFSNAALEGFSGLQVSRAPGSTVVSSHSSPADLAENHQLRSRRWSVDVGIANAISKPGLGQASSAGRSWCNCSDQQWGPIGFILGEHGPGHAGQLIR